MSLDQGTDIETQVHHDTQQLWKLIHQIELELEGVPSNGKIICVG